jgi:hypothetical protein
MKTVIKILTLCTLHFSLAFGNGGGPPQPPLFVNSEITGSPNQAPLFLADTSGVTLFTQVSFYYPSSIDGILDVEGTDIVPVTEKNNKNLNWQMPSATFNTGISIKVWKPLGIFCTLKIDSRENGITYSGSDFGLSFSMFRDSDVRARLDFGLTYLNMDMESTLLKRSDSSYSKKTESDNGLGSFASLSINTAFEEWAINPFLQVSYCIFPLFDFEWATARGISCTINTFTLTPGITYRISNNILIILGGNYIIPSDIENLSSEAIYSGFVQANFLF